MIRESRLIHAALLIVFLGWLAAPLLAHPAPYSYLDLRLSQNQLEGTLTIHVIDVAHDLNIVPPATLLDAAQLEAKREAILNLLRSRLSLTADGQRLAMELLRLEPLPDRDALALHLRFDTKTTPGSLSIQCLLFPYDPQHQTFLNIYENDALTQQELLDKDRTTFAYFTGTRQGAFAAAQMFLASGIHHIFIGPDHVLFLVGLLLLGGSLKRLLLIVTAFTVAHSLTLTLAALDIANPPARLIEAAIALSIVYVGIDNLLVGKAGRDVRAWIAFFFGLIHGFGFASVLKEFGLPRQALGWSLFSFNLGVEIGQVCIVVMVTALLTMLRKRNLKLTQHVVTLGSWVVILAGSFWFIQRVFF
ncbi:MAG TPA: HupE/UreJ family protein [Blastocatellia bacterium]|nr:HupE/UreJ family protein [Blastocatellia bacterium]